MKVEETHLLLNIEKYVYSRLWGHIAGISERTGQ